MTVIFRATSLPGDTEGLAGIPSRDAINSSKSICVERADVLVLRHVGPVLLQHGAAVRVDLAEGDGAEASGALKAEAEAANAAEQVENPELVTYCRSLNHTSSASFRPTRPRYSDQQRCRISASVGRHFSVFLQSRNAAAITSGGKVDNDS